jgi:molybdopterin converting factor small subunit
MLNPFTRKRIEQIVWWKVEGIGPKAKGERFREFGLQGAFQFEQIQAMVDMRLKLSYGREVLLSEFPDDDPVTVRQVMQAVKTGHPQIYARWCDAQGNLRETLTVFVNGDHIRYRNGLETVLAAGDEIYIVPLITGG